MTPREVQLIADTMAQLSVLKLGQKLLPFRSYGRSKFFIFNCPIFNRICKALANKKKNKKKNSLGIDTLFATLSDPPNPNLQFSSPVQSSGIALSSIARAAVALEIVLP